MKEWTRLPDWIAIVTGIAAAVSPAMIPTGQESAATLVALGALLAVAGFVNLAARSITAAFWVEVAAGVLFVIAPWILSFEPAAAWVFWVAGLIGIATGVGSLVRSRKTAGGRV